MRSNYITTWLEVEVTVLYDFTQAYDGGRQEPNYGANVDIFEVKIGDIDILPALTKAQLASLEEEALDQHEEGEGPDEYPGAVTDPWETSGPGRAA